MAKPEAKPRGKGRPFAKGNPFRFALGEGGRKTGSQDRANKLSVAYGEALEQLVEDGVITRAQAIAQRMAHIATTGKPGAAVNAAKELADRTEGKPVQAIQVVQPIDNATAQRIATIYEQMFGVSQVPTIEAQVCHDSSCQCLPCREKRHAAKDEKDKEALASAKMLGKGDCPTLPSQDVELMARLGVGPATGSAVLSQGQGIYIDLSSGERVK